MKAITIHSLDDNIARLIEAEAKREQTSVNKVVKRLLAQSLGIKPIPQDTHREAFSAFFGAWSQEQVQEFEASTSEFECIHPKDWR